MPLKVLIQIQKFKGGPAAFRSRLISSLEKMDGITIINDVDKKFDIELAFIRKTVKHNKPYVLRVSSCYYFDHYKPWNNKPIAKSIKNADHVIFQSTFAYKLCNRVLRLESRGLIRNGYEIIYNGVDLDYINEISPSKKVEPGSFVACARWDGNKRIKSMLNGFMKAGIKRHLYIIGGFGIEDRKKSIDKLIKKYNSKYIHILGERTNKETISIMKACDYQIHLSFIDICPNTVLEGMACGLNVLCTNLGGTAEIVGKNGVILNVDKFWKTKYLKKRIENLDNLESNIVASGIHKLIKQKIPIDINKFDINLVSKKYYNIIKEKIK